MIKKVSFRSPWSMDEVGKKGIMNGLSPTKRCQHDVSRRTRDVRQRTRDVRRENNNEHQDQQAQQIPGT